MKRRKLFGLTAGAAVTPLAAVAAPMVEMHVNDVAVPVQTFTDVGTFSHVIVGFNEDDGYWWMRSQIGDWHDLTRRTSLEVPAGWLDGMTRMADGVWQGAKVRHEVAVRYARYLRIKGYE
jgi:hypothetical protein